ncbi:YrdB family protein [Bacillus mycoides]|uniref:YrdB family protein n=1 Tax=Bacillus mycoides TaxID=1405 RepID=UPI001F16E032|nr:YrdB family protein [Bacillus mycoides]
MFINKRNVNLVIRFLLELCALVSLGYWGFQVGKSVYTKFVFFVLAHHSCLRYYGEFSSSFGKDTPTPFFA